MSEPEEGSIPMTKWKLKLLVFSLLLLSFCLYIGLPTHFLDFWPIPDAALIAAPYAEKEGYPLQGYLGQYTGEPNWLGRCEVSIEWHDHREIPARRKVQVYLSRSWRFGSWEVKDMKVEEIKPEPS